MTETNNILETSSNHPLADGGASVYFLGIGGIGMSALARYFNHKGIKVSGYDKTPTVLTRQLEAEGMAVHYIDDVKLIDRDAKIIVYTPAIPASHSELNYYRDNNYTLKKRSEVLGMITRDRFNICVAGTHGKTTTSAMVAHILRDSGYGCTAFLGGIATNYNSNFWSQSPSLSGSENKNVCVVEADEYDRSFLQLSPDIAVITSMDADHLDIYGTEKNMQDAFVAFTSGIKPGGLLISKKGLVRSADFVATYKKLYSSTDTDANIHAQNIIIKNGRYYFDVWLNDRIIKDVELNMGGMHNIENVIAAIAVAAHLQIDEDKIKKAVAGFAGVKRRFEYIIRSHTSSGEAVMAEPSQPGPVFIDDYAHHPEELRALIKSAKELYPAKKCTVVFQPHLYSRTKDLAEGFAEVLSLADEIILLPVYPARELPIPGVSSQLILDKITIHKSWIKEKEELLQWVKEHEIELLITSGAGDIDTLIEPLKQILQTPSRGGENKINFKKQD
jgi:UDP-N-acetylmuramate--alanine ligase